MTTAAKLLTLARAHIGERYVLGALAPKANARWSGPWDCAEFCSWCVYQTTGALFGCERGCDDPDRANAYTGFWGDDARRLGQIVPVGVAAATAGAFLLRLPSGGTGHVVISAGDGETIEAHSTRRGVIASTSAGRRWDLGVLVPGIAVTLADAPADEPEETPRILRLVDPPMRGVAVREVQRALRDAGISPGRIDGIFGAQTAAAVRAFQLQAGLVADGEVGPVTAKRLGVVLPEV